MRTWAAIFDWDGVVIDSSRQHEQAWCRLAAKIGRTVPPGVFSRSFGMKNERVLTTLLGWTQEPAELAELSARKEEFYRQSIREEGAVALPGIREWLERLRAAGVRCAVGTSTTQANVACINEQLGLAGLFDAWVCAEDVTRGKPDPEVFLLAARRLNALPNQCVVFEDAPVGVQAAQAAGMMVVAVTTTHPVTALADADVIVNRLDALSVEHFDAWFAG